MAWGGNDGAIDRWVKQLQENDPKLKSLHILSFRRVSAADLGRIFNAIGTNTVLEELYISGHALNVTVMDQLSEALTINETLHTLNLGTSTFGSDIDVFGLFCEGLAANEGLRKLDLENKGLLCNKQDKYRAIYLFAEALAKNKHLEELNLTRNELDDRAMEILAPALTGLLRINLGINNIQKLGAKAIAEQILVPSSKVEEMELSENPLLEGASLIAAALGNATKLRVLKLVDVVSDQSDFTALTPPALGNSTKLEDDDAEKNNKKADEKRIKYGSALASAIGQSLIKNKTVTHLWLDNNAIDSRALQSITDNLLESNVIELKLRQNLLNDEAACSLASAASHRLKHLELGENSIGPKGFGMLMDSQLNYLGLFNNAVGGFGADPANVPELLTSRIQRLDIGCNKITHEDVAAIADLLLKQGVPELKVLEMGGNVQDTEYEQWEETIARILAQREDLDIIWKRRPDQIDSTKPPVL